MRTIWKGAAALVLALAGLLPLHGGVEAAQKCRRYRDVTWGYAFCTEGPTRTYWSRARCVHWIGDIPIVQVVNGNFARKAVDASVFWCPDGFHIIRGSRIRVFWI